MKIYQPNDEWCERVGLASYEVFAHLFCARRLYPRVPQNAWLELDENDIEEPSFIDWPECEQYPATCGIRANQESGQ